MAYIGNKPTVGNFQICDAISVVNGQAAYTMQVGSVNVTPQSANHMIVSLNGTIQKPNSSYTVANSVITFSSNLATGDVIDFIQILGDVLDLGVPSDATVTAAKLNNDIISGTTALTSSPQDTDEFLISDAGTLKRIDASLIVGGKLTVADYWRITADFQTSGGDITANWERVDTDGYGTIGTAMTQSSGIFTFPSTGIYLLNATSFTGGTSAACSYIGLKIKTTTDNSSYSEASTSFSSAGSQNYHASMSCSFIFDVTNVSTHKCKLFTDVVSSLTADYSGSSSATRTGMYFIKLGDT